MNEIIDFTNLDTQGKIAICNQCQKILGESFPDSEYTLTKANVSAGIDFYKKLIDRFKGNVFKCSKAIIFYKENNVENAYDKQNEFLRIYREPHTKGGNCIFIEFIAADISNDNIADLEHFFFGDKRVEYVMASRKGVIYLETTKTLQERARRMGNRGGFISSFVS